MSDVATTKLSTKGQVVIPESVRRKLELAAGTEFVVIGHDDTVVLKAITPPTLDDFADLISDARRLAKSAGLRKSDIKDALKDFRSNK